MTTPEPTPEREPQPRDIAMEMETPEQAADLEAESRDDGSEDREDGDRAQP